MFLKWTFSNLISPCECSRAAIQSIREMDSFHISCGFPEPFLSNAVQGTILYDIKLNTGVCVCMRTVYIIFFESSVRNNPQSLQVEKMDLAVYLSGMLEHHSLSMFLSCHLLNMHIHHAANN